MSIQRLSVNQLVCLDALLVERNVSRAAARVYLSQSAMSCALARLREHFNDDLLIQSGRNMVPTSLAKTLAKPVKDVLNQLQIISAMKTNFDPQVSGRRITIAITDYDVYVLMMRVLQNVWAIAPNMCFDLRPFDTGFLEQLDSAEIDVLLVADFVSSKNHPSEFLFEDTYSSIVWTGNSRVADQLPLDLYLDMGHVTTRWGNNKYVTYEEQQHQLAGYFRRIEIVAPSLITAPLFVVNTDRVATVTTRLARLMAKQWPLRILPCPVKVPPITEVIQWQKSLDNDPAIQWFRAQVATVTREMMSTDKL